MWVTQGNRSPQLLQISVPSETRTWQKGQRDVGTVVYGRWSSIIYMRGPCSRTVGKNAVVLKLVLHHGRQKHSRLAELASVVEVQRQRYVTCVTAPRFEGNVCYRAKPGRNQPSAWRGMKDRI